MRLAVFSDIHGNLLALEAVLADIEAQGLPDAYWVLGDLAAFCPWPAETIERLQALPDASFLRGNTDRYLVTGRRPQQPPVRSAQDWAALPDQLAERDANFRWTVARLSYADYAFLNALPVRLEMEVPGYGAIAAVHATAEDDETFLTPDVSDGDIRDHFCALKVSQGEAPAKGQGSSLVLYGHTHRPVDRVVGDMRVVNDGSVGMPLDGDPRPAYALLDFEGAECAVTIHRVSYNRDAVLAQLAQVDHPAKSWVGQKLRNAG